MENDGKYGLLPDVWRDVQAELRDLLVAVARQRTLITYGELAAQVMSARVQAGSYVFTGMLRDVCRDLYEETGVMLCALVVKKDTGKPGAGYFRAMACPDGDLDACWRADCEAVFAYYAQKEEA